MAVAAVPPTEEINELTGNLEEHNAEGFARTLRGVDCQIFAGWRHHVSLLDERSVAALEKASVAAASVLSRGGCIVMSGCGTSGRIAATTAARFNDLLARFELPGVGKSPFRYTIAGGDAALVLSDELPEDNPKQGAADMDAVIGSLSGPVMLVGVTCGLSAPYVAGQVAAALDKPVPSSCAEAGSPRGFGIVLLGFNSVELARAAPCGSKTVRDVFLSLDQRAEKSPWHVVLNPIVGPEAVAGSSRMKGGSATLLLLDTLCAQALRRIGAVDLCPSTCLHDCLTSYMETVMRSYAKSESLAAIMSAAASALRRPQGRMVYIGSGLAGRMGVTDASEMPDTYGAPFDQTRAFVIGGWPAMRCPAPPVEESGPRASLLEIAADGNDVRALRPGDMLIMLALPDTCDTDFSQIESLASMAAEGVSVAAFVISDCGLAVSKPSLRPACKPRKLHYEVSLPLARLLPGAAELALKLLLNCVSTYAQSARGLVYKGEMVSTGPSNAKIMERCLRLICKFGHASTPAVAEDFLWRAVHRVDKLTSELRSLSQEDHIRAATPTGDELRNQDMTLSSAILLSTGRYSVATARAALAKEPRLCAHLRQVDVSALKDALGVDAKQKISEDLAALGQSTAKVVTVGNGLERREREELLRFLDERVCSQLRERQQAETVQRKKVEQEVSTSTDEGSTGSAAASAAEEVEEELPLQEVLAHHRNFSDAYPRFEGLAAKCSSQEVAVECMDDSGDAALLGLAGMRLTSEPDAVSVEDLHLLQLQHQEWEHALEIEEAEAEARARDAEVKEQAAIREREEVQAFLTLHGFVDVRARCSRLLNPCYPLHVAVARNDAAMVEMLLRAGADPTQRNLAGLTPRQLALWRNRKGSHSKVLSSFNNVKTESSHERLASNTKQ